MNLIETLVAKAAQEACELGKALLKLNTTGIKATDSETGEPLTLDAIKQLNEILGCVELLRDRGIPLAGIGDPVAVGEAKRKIVEDMEKSMQAGTLTLTEDDQNPRPEGVNEAVTGLPEGEGGGDGDQNNGEGDDLGADGTGASDGDGTAPDDSNGDDTGSGDDTGGGDDQGGGEDETDDDTSGDDTGSGDDAGDDTSADDEESEEEEEEPGSNDV